MIKSTSNQHLFHLILPLIFYLLGIFVIKLQFVSEENNEFLRHLFLTHLKEAKVMSSSEMCVGCARRRIWSARSEEKALHASLEGHLLAFVANPPPFNPIRRTFLKRIVPFGLFALCAATKDSPRTAHKAKQTKRDRALQLIQKSQKITSQIDPRAHSFYTLMWRNHKNIKFQIIFNYELRPKLSLFPLIFPLSVVWCLFPFRGCDIGVRLMLHFDISQQQQLKG